MLVLLGGACSHRTASCSSWAATCHADIAASAASFGPASEAAGQAAGLTAGPAAEPAADRPVEPPILFLSLHWGHHIPAQLVETLLTNVGREVYLCPAANHMLCLLLLPFFAVRTGSPRHIGRFAGSGTTKRKRAYFSNIGSFHCLPVKSRI